MHTTCYKVSSMTGVQLRALDNKRQMNSTLQPLHPQSSRQSRPSSGDHHAAQRCCAVAAKVLDYCVTAAQPRADTLHKQHGATANTSCNCSTYQGIHTSTQPLQLHSTAAMLHTHHATPCQGKPRHHWLSAALPMLTAAASSPSAAAPVAARCRLLRVSSTTTVSATSSGTAMLPSGISTSLIKLKLGPSQ